MRYYGSYKALNGHLTCILERQLNNCNLPAAQINYVIIQTLSKNQHFTDLCAVNKRLTRIISNGSLIINPFVWHVWIHWDCKTSRCSRRVQKIKGRFTESDKRMHRLNAPVFFLFFLFWLTRFVGPRFDKWIPKPCTSWSDVAYNGVWSGYYWLLFFFFFFVDCRKTWV